MLVRLIYMLYEHIKTFIQAQNFKYLGNSKFWQKDHFVQFYTDSMHVSRKMVNT